MKRGKITAEVPVLSEVNEKKNFACGVRELNQSLDVSRGDEVNLLCFVYNRGEVVLMPIDDLVQDGNVSESDYMYLFSVKFE